MRRLPIYSVAALHHPPTSSPVVARSTARTRRGCVWDAVPRGLYGRVDPASAAGSPHRSAARTQKATPVRLADLPALSVLLCDALAPTPPRSPARTTVHFRHAASSSWEKPTAGSTAARACTGETASADWFPVVRVLTDLVDKRIVDTADAR